MTRFLPTALMTIAMLGSVFATDIDEIAREILDPQRATADREALISANLSQATAILQAMTRDLATGTPQEYERIPWIWRMSVAVGKSKDGASITRVLNISLPKANEPMPHWQAVVIGGGIINGLSLEGVWPSQRVAELVSGDAELKARWERSLKLATLMADDEKVPTGTRYDALRMIAMLPWLESGEQLRRYLRKEVHPELQQGAISGMSDMDGAPVADALISSLVYLPEKKRDLAINALFRSDERSTALRKALDSGTLRDLPPGILLSIQDRIARQRQASQ
jgi:hypothetical protein